MINFLLAYITEIVMHLCVRMLMQRGTGTILMNQVMRISTKCFLTIMTTILSMVCISMLFTLINTAIGLSGATITN